MQQTRLYRTKKHVARAKHVKEFEMDGFIH